MLGNPHPPLPRQGPDTPGPATPLQPSRLLLPQGPLSRMGGCAAGVTRCAVAMPGGCGARRLPCNACSTMHPLPHEWHVHAEPHAPIKCAFAPLTCLCS